METDYHVDRSLAEAMRTFEDTLARARNTQLQEPTAAILATVAKNGLPSARTVLVRGQDARGFVFFTNSQSRKGRELAEKPVAALCFYWDSLHEQVRIEGSVVPVSDQESDAYWITRPRESQIGAWASKQSTVLPSRETLAEAFAMWEAKYQGMAVPRPDHWHGYRVVPNRIEFWKGLAARLHERLVYERSDQGWHKYLLSP